MTHDTFIHLNVHSAYSPMRGTASQGSLVARAAELEMPFLALTEVNGLWGFVRFVEEAEHAGIRPIAGTNIINETVDLVLLAQNRRGYENISRILSNEHLAEYPDTLTYLCDHREGIFVLCPDPGHLRELARRIPSSHLFAELRPDTGTQALLKTARELGIEPVATGDVYFLAPEEAETWRILRAIDQNTTLSEIPESEEKSAQHYFAGEEEMLRRFPHCPEAVSNTFYLAQRCKTDWNFVNNIFPEMSLRKTHRANARLKKLVHEGARRRYDKITPEVESRIERELNLIFAKGFAPYFLVVQDIVAQATKTVGRGSGAASIVSYCLFITQVDPVKYDLYFERFLHEERIDLPDIDIDFCWDERDDILEYVFEKYGEERAAMVSNQVMLQPRSAVREVGKVYGLSNEEIKAVTKRLGYSSGRKGSLLEVVKTDPRFRNLNLDETLEAIIEQGERIVGVFRHSSVHPGGVVVVPDEIRKYVPVLRATKGVQIVEWEKDQVEDAGLVKIDLLGNRSLAVVRDTLEQVNRYYGRNIDYHDLDPVNDPETVLLMESGRTMGVFYIESPATRQLLAKAGVVDFEHVVIYSSIIRPAANRYINVLIDRIHGAEWEVPHPDLDFLEESYGIMVYEEQVSMVGRVMAGMSYAQSDRFRKVMSRRSKSWQVEEVKSWFFRGARERGYAEDFIGNVWDMVKSFEGYSFNKPHSASYAMLSFKCAYLKAHYPAEFLAAVVSNQGGFYSAYAYLNEARRFGIRVLLPDINKSGFEYRGYRDKILMGFIQIQHLRQDSIETVLNERKRGDFASLGGFLERVSIPFGDVKAFIKAGCFDRLERKRSRPELIYNAMEHYYRNANGASEARMYEREERPEFRPPDHRDTVRMELESFGFPVSEHPLDKYAWYLETRTIKAERIPEYVGKRVNLAGVNITRKAIRTRQGERMEFLTFEDQTDIFECVLFPEMYEKYNDLVRWEQIFVLQGMVESSYGVCTVTIEKMASIEKSIEKWRRKHGVGEKGVESR